MRPAAPSSEPNECSPPGYSKYVNASLGEGRPAARMAVASARECSTEDVVSAVPWCTCALGNCWACAGAGHGHAPPHLAVPRLVELQASVSGERHPLDGQERAHDEMLRVVRRGERKAHRACERGLVDGAEGDAKVGGAVRIDHEIHARIVRGEHQRHESTPALAEDGDALCIRRRRRGRHDLEQRRDVGHVGVGQPRRALGREGPTLDREALAAVRRHDVHEA